MDAPKKATLKSHVFQPVINGQKLLAIKPQTFMNLSGEAVGVNFYKLTPAQICIVTDDLMCRLVRLGEFEQGWGGTHNGMVHYSTGGQSGLYAVAFGDWLEA